MEKLSGNRLLITAVVAGVLAIAAAYYYLYLKEQQLLATYRPASKATISVVVPARDLIKGEAITQENIAALNVPVEFLPSNALTADRYESALGRTLKSAVQRGKPLSWDSVTGDPVDRFSQMVKVGRRAKTISISKINSIDGLLRPGDRVDLYGKFSASEIGTPTQEGFSDDVVLLVLQNVEVLAAGKEDSSGRRYERFVDQSSFDGFNMAFSTVTLHVTDYQASKIELAQQAGELVAYLRNPNDSTASYSKPVGVQDLLRPDPSSQATLVVDASGKSLGRVVGEQVLDDQGNVIGRVINGKAIGLNGQELGDVVTGQVIGDTFVADGGEEIGNVASRTLTELVVRDANGQVIGKIEGDSIVDAQGNVIGKFEDGKALGLDGTELGLVEQQVIVEEVVLDERGQLIGKVENGMILDANGSVVGEIKDGKAVTLGGWAITGVESIAPEPPAENKFVEFIAGGKGSDGVNPVQKLLVDSGEEE